MDEDNSGGMSGAAGYLLGRMAAEANQSRSRMMAALARRRRPPAEAMYGEAEVFANIEEWRALVRLRNATIQQVRSELAVSAEECDRLRTRNKQLEAEATQTKEAHAALQQRAAVAEEAWRDAGHERDMADLALCVARMDLAQMKEEVERLKGGGS